LRKKITDNANLNTRSSGVQISGSNSGFGQRPNSQFSRTHSATPSTQSIYCSKVFSTNSYAKIDSKPQPSYNHSRCALPPKSRPPSVRNFNTAATSRSNAKSLAQVNSKPFQTEVIKTSISHKLGTDTPDIEQPEITPASPKEQTGDSSATNFSKTELGQKTVSQIDAIVYKGHKMIPAEALESREKEIAKLEAEKKYIGVTVGLH
jgi:hypothetical protein